MPSSLPAPHIKLEVPPSIAALQKVNRDAGDYNPVMTAYETTFSVLANRYTYGKFALLLNDMRFEPKAGMYRLTFSRSGLTRIIGIPKDRVLKDGAAGRLSESTKRTLNVG